MSARTVTITPDGSIIVIRGWKVAQLARQAGLKATFSGAAGGWMLDAKRLPDLTAWLDYRNVRYKLEGTQVGAPVVDLAPPREPSAEGLW